MSLTAVVGDGRRLAGELILLVSPNKAVLMLHSTYSTRIQYVEIPGMAVLLSIPTRIPHPCTYTCTWVRNAFLTHIHTPINNRAMNHGPMCALDMGEECAQRCAAFSPCYFIALY